MDIVLSLEIWSLVYRHGAKEITKKEGMYLSLRVQKVNRLDSKFKFKPVELPRKGFNSLESPHCASMRVD